MKKLKVSVGVILYYSEKYLKFFLDSLLSQEGIDLEILCLDHSTGKSSDLEFIKRKYRNNSKIKLIQGENLGFAKGHNKLITMSKYDFYACLNPDMYFAPDFLLRLVSFLEENNNTASVGGKIYSWDFAKKSEKEIIDSCGLEIHKNHQFSDIGQGDIDLYFQDQEVFGISGAAVVFNKEHLQTVAYKNQVFDEMMFMYKEDCDLAYRLRLAGFKSFLISSAHAYHDRTVSKTGSLLSSYFKKSRQVREWSYLNHLVLLLKNFDFSYSLSVITWTFLNAIFRTILIFLTQPLVIFKAFRLFFCLPEIFAKKRAVPRKLSAQKLESFMT